MAGSSTFGGTIKLENEEEKTTHQSSGEWLP